MRYSPTFAISVSQAIINRKSSIRGISRQNGLDPKEVVVWCALYRAYGEGVFYTTQNFSPEERRFIVKEMFETGLSLTEVCIRHKILHRSSLRNWIRQYRDGRFKTMSDNKKAPKEQGKPEDPSTKRIRELERELLYARAENAYLKKLQALMQATKNQSAD